MDTRADASGLAGMNGEELGRTRTGLDPRTAAMLAYSAWWLTGAMALVIEPDNRFVQFHARQALLGFGAIWAAGFALWSVSFLSVFLWPAAFAFTAGLAQLTWACGIVLWAVALVQASRGRYWALPLVGTRRTAGRAR